MSVEGAPRKQGVITGSATPILKLDHITKRFPGVLAVDDVSISVHQGEVVALLGGPSAAPPGT